MTEVKVPDVPAVLTESDDDMAQAMGALFGSLVTKARGYYDVINRYATQDETILGRIETSTDEACVAYRQRRLEEDLELRSKEQGVKDANEALAAAKAKAEAELAPLEDAARKAAMGPDDVAPEQLAKATEGVRNVASTAAKNVSLLKAMTNIDLGDWGIPTFTAKGTRSLGSGSEPTFTPAFSKIVVDGDTKPFNKMFELARWLKVDRKSIAKRMEVALSGPNNTGRQAWEALNVGDEFSFNLTKKGSGNNPDKVYNVTVTKTVKGAEDAPEPEDNDDNVDGVVEEASPEA
jgi:hypothetical protein